MLKSKINHYNILTQGLFFIALGFLLISEWTVLWVFLRVILTCGFIYLGISQLFSLLIGKKKQFRLSNILSIIASFGIALYSLINPMRFITFIPYVIGWWALINGIVQAINFYVYRRDCMRGTGWRFLLALVTLVMAAVLIFFPESQLRFLSRLSGGYLVFYGLVTFFGSLKDILSPVTQRRLMKHMSISAPVFLASLTPQRVFLSIDALAKTKRLETSDPSVLAPSDLEVFFYLTKSGPESLGHVDISYKGQIFSYGCHDPENRHLFGTLGDGVLVISPREEFLNHALVGENKVIISYGIVLTEKQKAVLEKRLIEMLGRSIPWQSQAELGNEEAKDYASRVYRSTHAQMLKFEEGKFRTYFVFSTNCVLLADHILRCPQLELFNITGIVTPGTYLSFLNDEYCREGSVVTTRTIYRGED